MSGVISVVTIVLQLTVLNTTEVKIISTVVISKYRRIDRVAASNGFRLRSERPGWVIAYRNTYLENTVGTLGREVKIVFTVFGGSVRRPHLALCPRYIFHMQCHATIYGGAIRRVHGQYVVILHSEMIAVIVKRDSGINIVRRIDIDFSVKYMSRWIGGINMGYQRL